MVHEHLYYPTGPGVYGQLGESFTRLYLAGGVTTMRTGGNMNGYMDLNLKRAIEAGQKAGPAIDATAPYLNGPNTFQQMTAVAIGRPGAAARRVLGGHRVRRRSRPTCRFRAPRWARPSTRRHKRGMKVTGHLCSVTYSEATDLGIDNLEHGFLAATDFVPTSRPTRAPARGAASRSIAALDESSDRSKRLSRN